MSAKTVSISRMTARELLVDIAGNAHAIHSITKRHRVLEGKITLECSCGKVFRAAATQEAKDALKNVPESSPVIV